MVCLRCSPRQHPPYTARAADLRVSARRQALRPIFCSVLIAKEARRRVRHPHFGPRSRASLAVRSRFVINVGIAAVYVAAAKFGFTMAFTAEQVTLVWPPTGLALAALLLLSNNDNAGDGDNRVSSVWPGVFLGAFVANITTHEPFGVAAGIATGNTLEAVAAAWAIRRFVGTGHAINWLRYAMGLVIFGALASTVISATIGVTSLCAGGLQPWGAFRPLWRTWWLGDAAGDLLIAPVLLTWSARPRIRTAEEALEPGILIACVITVSAAVFTRRFPAAAPSPLEYTVFPFIIWAAIRFGVAGASVANLLTAVVAVWGTVHGFGPYAAARGDERLLLLQIFMGVVAGSGLILGAAISERDASKARKAGMLEAALDCIVTIDHVGRILEFNPAAEQTFGHRRADVIGQEMADLIIPAHLRDRYRRGFARYARSGVSPLVGRRLETVAMRADGTEFPVEFSVTRMPSEGPPTFTGFLRDITERKKMVNKLAFRATHDPLTKMLNKAAFMERLTLAARRANVGRRSDIAVLFVDLDKFKAVNDQFGHVVGDRLIVAIARRLRASVRPSDAVGRLGGDEFAVLLEKIDDEAEVSAVVERIQDALDKPLIVEGCEIQASASVGIAFASQSGPKAEAMLRAADAAMYRAKASVEA